MVNVNNFLKDNFFGNAYQQIIYDFYIFTGHSIGYTGTPVTIRINNNVKVITSGEYVYVSYITSELFKRVNFVFGINKNGGIVLKYVEPIVYIPEEVTITDERYYDVDKKYVPIIFECMATMNQYMKDNEVLS